MKKTTIGFAGLCAVGFLLLSPMTVQASGTGSISDMMRGAGIASLYTLNMTEDECLQAAAEAKDAYWGYTNLGIADVEANLNVRKEPSTTAEVVGKMPKDSACEILETEDGWAHISSGEVEGYVSLDYLLTGADAKVYAKNLVKTVAKVNAEALKVRAQASLEASVLTTVPRNEELNYIETVDQWVKVSIDGHEAYVFGEYVTLEEKLATAVTMRELRYGEGVTDLRVDIVEYAKQFLGNPYKWGGTSLTKGADCSGFVQSVLKHFDIKISRTSRTQSKDGTKISASKLQPGDLCFYADSSGTINHVAMYIGDGQVIHASNKRDGIKISKYNYRTPAKCVDVIQD